MIFNDFFELANMAKKKDKQKLTKRVHSRIRFETATQYSRESFGWTRLELLL